jgi:molybdopterin synthase catalytic subunit
MNSVMLLSGPIDTAVLLKQVASDEAGANLLFTGTTRRTTGDVLTDWLDYETYEPLARAELSRLRLEAVATFGLCGCAIAHRLGRVAVGETSVAVAVSAGHRQEAFAAATWLMEELKRCVPLWKQEVGPAGAVWIHPDPADKSAGVSQ